MIKWNKKICIEHITQLKDPLENMGKEGQANLSPLTQKLRELSAKFRMPRM